MRLTLKKVQERYPEWHVYKVESENKKAPTYVATKGTKIYSAPRVTDLEERLSYHEAYRAEKERQQQEKLEQEQVARQEEIAQEQRHVQERKELEEKTSQLEAKRFNLTQQEHQELLNTQKQLWQLCPTVNEVNELLQYKKKHLQYTAISSVDYDEELFELQYVINSTHELRIELKAKKNFNNEWYIYQDELKLQRHLDKVRADSLRFDREYQQVIAKQLQEGIKKISPDNVWVRENQENLGSSVWLDVKVTIPYRDSWEEYKVGFYSIGKESIRFFFTDGFYQCAPRVYSSLNEAIEDYINIAYIANAQGCWKTYPWANIEVKSI